MRGEGGETAITFLENALEVGRVAVVLAGQILTFQLWITHDQRAIGVDQVDAAAIAQALAHEQVFEIHQAHGRTHNTFELAVRP
ncbi:hypothetical protein ALO94_200411 [Pseudomonas syringae pv. spinaceae]|uniref:Uncharacterized protein n=1 Tax=Pseudomonas syringae pv. spinaceae TaxID=264459 RepID=A0A0Q0BQN4_PSESX|nr:hypothetical protein ALO94_200411 [Pseudomonas syringae pv. spinaceae]